MRFWWTVELFSPPKIDVYAPGDPTNPVVRWVPGEPLPWTSLRAPSGKGMVWEHKVYLGVYQMRDIYQALHCLFPADDDAYDDPGKGESACAAILVDQQGRLVGDTAVLSSAAWGLGRAHDPGPSAAGWLAGFHVAAADFEDTLDTLQGRRARAAGTDKAPPLDTAAVESIRDLAIAAAGVACEPALAAGVIRIASRQVRARASDDPPTSDFLNSFFLVDLKHVADAVVGGDLGSALAAYLRPDAHIDENRRVDVRGVEGEQQVIERTGVDHMPAGRWPSDPAHHLALSQQFAVNEAFATLGPAGGLMGVNGPPGTGKTTMLRDLVAGIVVDRASRLATLSQPGDAFEGKRLMWPSEPYDRRLRCLRPEFTGFEIVVASSNNAAVENISNELPAASAIDERWAGRADYFGTLATRTMHAADQTKRDAGSQAWGLIAARLGNADNRGAFMEAFWWDASRGPTLQSLLKTPPRSPTWEQSVQAFTAARTRVQQLLADRRAAEQRIGEFAELSEALRDLPGKSSDLRAEIARRDEQIASHTPFVENACVKWQAAKARRGDHENAQPKFWENLFSCGKAKAAWKTELERLAKLRDNYGAEYSQLYDHNQALTRARAVAADKLSRLHNDGPNMQRRLHILTHEVADDENRYGLTYPGQRWRDNPEHRHLHGPWLDSQLNEARSELFLAAMDLHKAFLAHTPGIGKDLNAVVEVVQGRAPKDLSPVKVRAAWQLFFMVVPVVSTAFASVGRMFAQVPSESFGWLFIDEAGQACPQHAVGAIWRARRVLAVGDPQQLTPVVTIPRRAQYAIAKSFHVGPPWMPRQTSVQQLADRTGTWGTELTNGEQATWVSAPLRVHRRCDDPMFTLCNQIAYDNFMIQGSTRTPDSSDLFDRLPPSDWRDVPATTSGTHRQEGDIDMFRRRVTALLHRGVSPADIIAISPFRSMADQLELIADREYPGMRAGTVHTAQGREAPVVFLVLGGDPDNRGAREWCARTPNLVNVAASRAQRRLYVIGDRGRWAPHSHFSELASTLSAG